MKSDRYRINSRNSADRLLATAVTGRNMAQVWSLATGEKVGIAMPHPGDIYGLSSLSFSPDGKRLVTGHKDGRIRTFHWQTGELVGVPLQHPNQVHDVKLTADGKFLLSCGREGQLQVWDFATGKLAVPPLSPANSQFNTAHSIAISGERVVVSSIYSVTVLDLSMLLPPIEEDLPSLLRHAELATNQKQQLGELVPLEPDEWSTRWEQLVAARQTPDQVAESLARAFDDAADAPARSLVIARSTRRGVLEHLQTLRPKSPQLLWALVLDQGRQSRNGRQSLPERPLDAGRLRDKVLKHLSEVGTHDSVEPSMTKNIAQLLTADAPGGRWIPLEPTAMKGAAETTFTPQPNGFILAGIGNKQPETFSIEARPAVKRVAALRLDVAPHASLASGSGHGGGNLHLTAVRVRVRRADGTETEMKLSRAAADYVRSPEPGTKETDGPWGVLDSDQQTRWDIFPHAKQPHWLILIPDAPCDMAANDSLIVELDSGDQTYRDTRLGHFRLSVSEESRAELADELIAAVRQDALHSDELLAAAYLISGEAQVALNILQHAEKRKAAKREGEAPAEPRTTKEPDSTANGSAGASPSQQASPSRTLLRALLLAAAQQQLGQREVAQQTVKAAVADSPFDPWPHSLTGFYRQALRDFGGLSHDDIVQRRAARDAERAVEHELRDLERELVRLARMIEAKPTDATNHEARANSLMRLGRWREAADDWTVVRKLTSNARHHWFTDANCRLLAGDEAAYKQLCQDMVQQFRGSTDAQVADSIIKTCLLSPGRIDPSELPTQLLHDVLKDPTKVSFHPWFVGSAALSSYRAGKYDEALAWAKKHPDNKSQSGALALTVRSMAEHQLGQHEEARKSLDQAEAEIPKSLRPSSTPAPQPQRPTPAADIAPDWLAPELLRREAAKLMK